MNAGMPITNVPCPHNSSVGKLNTMPHSHQHHQHLHGHHHSHRLHSSSTNQSSNDDSKGSCERKMDEQQQQQQKNIEKYATIRRDDSSRSFSDVRKSAPDVVIISGCTSSH
jgi:transcription initiation factor IIF auxiliary subunit